MDQAEKDLLTIKRDGLLTKKRLIDVIEKLRQAAADGKQEFITDCFNITNATGIHQFNPLKDLLDSIEKTGGVSFIVERSYGGRPWGYDAVKIILTDQFDQVSSKIREEYHELNEKLGRKVENQNTVKPNGGLVKYTNPFWIIWRIFQVVWKHKVLSGLIVVVGLLAVDYSLAWKNIQAVINYIKSLFI